MSRRALHGFNPARLRELRDEQGLSRSDLGRLSGVPYNTIRRWETGETAPAPELLARVAKTLGVATTTLAAVDDRTQTLAGWRIQKGFTQNDAASALNMSLSTYSRLERGERPLSIANTRTLSRFFEITEDQVRSSWKRAHQRPGTHRQSP